MLPKRKGKGSTSISSQDDPFVQAMKPPANETPDERAVRLSREQDAAKRSKEIDDALATERREMEKRDKMIKVLLLGQSESGKSTTLKNFKLTFAPAQFHAQKKAWRAVVQLNLIASVRVIIEALQNELSESDRTNGDSSATPPFGHGDTYKRNVRSPSPSTTTPSRPPASFSRPKTPTRRLSGGPDSFSSSSSQRNGQKPLLTNEHRKLIMRLGPLLQVERQLAQAINPESPTCAFGRLSLEANEHLREGRLSSKPSKELVVRAGSSWMNNIGEANSNYPDKDGLSGQDDSDSISKSSPTKGSSIGRPIFRNLSSRILGGESREAQDDATTGPAVVLEACCEDIVTLWADEVVRDVLKKRGLDMPSYPGFFLDETERIARNDYEVTPDDILRARVMTSGVEEHHLQMEATTNGHRRDWLIYDVGGHRSNRHKWIPYFENVDAIIFLAPLVFTQVLEEDPEVNRIEDSLEIWKKICANQLLCRATLILFLNKMDIVERTLKSGIRLKDYVPSYGDGPNELGHVVKYFRSKFKANMKALSPIPRHSYCHETSVIDSKATSAILQAVRQGVIIHNLAQAHVI